MASERARPRAPPFIDPPGYARHRPEATLLYVLVERQVSWSVRGARSAARGDHPLGRGAWAERRGWARAPPQASLL